ncbi:hypothetical protein [Erwinia oleae]|uniref:hypothetical protein n=1 Tax=Erwinia oleae TaxID=796334 RepID=UPI000B17602C|nr:hypothetical protein [Erwinia oleae]
MIQLFRFAGKTGVNATITVQRAVFCAGLRSGQAFSAYLHNGFTENAFCTVRIF